MTNAACPTEGLSATAESFHDGIGARQFDIYGGEIGIGYVRPDLANAGRKLKVRMLRELRDAEIVEESPYDPKNETIRKDG